MFKRERERDTRERKRNSKILETRKRNGVFVMERTKAKEKPLCMSERERVHQVIQLMGPKCVPLCLVSEARVEGKFTLCSPRAASTNQNRAKVSRRTRGPMGSEHSSLQLFSPLHFLSFLHDDEAEAEAEGTERRKKVTISRSRHN